MKLLDRYLIIQFFEVLAVGTLLIAGVFFGTFEFKRILTTMCETGAPWQTCLTITALQLPGTCVYCLPGGVFFATMFVLLRMGMDSEILALRISGVSLLRILQPFFLLGLVTTLFSFTLNEFVVPSSRRIANKLMIVAAYRSELPVGSSSFNGVLLDERGQVKHVLLVDNHLQNRLRNILLFDVSKRGVIELIWSRVGVWQSGNWSLRDGRIYQLLLDGAAAGKTTAQEAGASGAAAVEKTGASQLAANGAGIRTSRFANMVIPGISSFAVDLAKQSFLPSEMSTAQLSATIKALEAAGKPVDDLLRLRLQKRLSQPVACFLLILAAAPLALLGRRSRATAGFIYGGLVMAIYFLLQDLFAALGENFRIDPFFAAWLPATILAFFGLALWFARCRQEA